MSFVSPSYLSSLTQESRLKFESWFLACSSNTSSLQVWNGIVINSTDFSRTVEWSKVIAANESSVLPPPENIPGPVRNAPYSSTDSSIKFPDPALEQENIFPRTLEVRKIPAA